MTPRILTLAIAIMVASCVDFDQAERDFCARNPVKCGADAGPTPDAGTNEHDGGSEPLPTWYRDADGDGYGDKELVLRQIERPAGYVSNSDDCDDSNGATAPGAPETCDGADNNCNGYPDEAACNAVGRTRIAAGPTHSLAVKKDGTAWAWGQNYDGQLGDGTTTNRLTPVQVSGLTGVVAVAAGYSHSLALKSDGTVWAWGLNANGQVGDGPTTTIRSRPVQVPGLSSMTAVAAGQDTSLSVRSDGTVWAWGANNVGNLGDGTTTRRFAPVQVHGLTGVVSVSASSYGSMALKSDGTVWTWGSNAQGQLGDGTTTDRLTPVQVPGFTNGAAVARGARHTLAQRADGTIWVWGLNVGEQTGMGYVSPVQVEGLIGIALATGQYQAFIVMPNGAIRAWGDNRSGQLGDGTQTKPPSPVLVPGHIGFVGIASGDYHTIAMKADGTVWAWGDNYYGQLGDGTTTGRLTPVQVQGLGN